MKKGSLISLYKAVLFPAIFFAAISTAYAAPALSPNNVAIGLGQTVTLFAQGSAPVYMTSNASPIVANLQANGTQQIIITGIQVGGTTALVCYVGTASDCANLSVNVQTGNVLSFSQNNITLVPGQNTAITVSGGNGTYSMNGNSNLSAASAVLSSSTITVTGVAAGNMKGTVCDSSGSCATISVSVSGSATGSSLTISNASPSLAVGQTTTVAVSGGSGYYITANSNSSVASPLLSGSSLTISALASGSSTITVCSASNGCGSVVVSVGSTSASSAITFGVANPTVAVGQSLNVSLSGGSGYFVSSNSNSGIAQGNVNGSTLALNGIAAGSNSLTICASSGGCGTIVVTVTSTSASTSTQSVSVQSGASTDALLAAIKAMQAQLVQMLEQIQVMGNSLKQLAASVVSSAAGSQATGSLNSLTFTQLLQIGSQGTQVTALQKLLAKLGFYQGQVSGRFDSSTKTAVEKFQSANNISVVGYVGPSTRTVLNAQ